ncbi:hypothetical protein I5G63_gp071 [Mycobacterium phage Imvubu]|uniref:Uncharacterized protein n=1 Tax=Mycobacterium phage Imvubu TaxID=2686233 RepID=A0A6B9L7N5_9CAUD|nr:hypothetical protein I5G63_gp071 [Mycobacterium phage Imvubu]QHB37812.1 hypothetical protein PBI_IMVUBU_71 [Mycobacterium phage Imvubu]
MRQDGADGLMGRGGRRAMARNRAMRKAMGSVRTAGCLTPDKRRYRTLGEAVADAARLVLEGRTGLTPYPCGRHYHLTSSARRG